MLDLRRLAVLEAVARHGSFTAAAQSLSYTQSAVSQHVAALERETGTELVVRSGRRIWLSDAGAVLVEHARRILAAVADAEADLAATTELRRGTVRLAAFPSAGATLIPRAAAAFRRAHPGLTLSLTGAEPAAAVDGLLSGVYDVAVTLTDSRTASGSRHDRDLHRIRLLDDPFHVVLPPGHPLVDQDVVRLSELSSQTWIATSSPGHPDADTLAHACAAAGFIPHVAFHIDDYLAVQGFIAAGVGVSLIPRLALSAVRDDVVVRPLEPATYRQVDLVLMETRRPAPAVLALVQTLVEAAGDLQ
jgi:DNA-binding transcriptional LysR family regulator